MPATNPLRQANARDRRRQPWAWVGLAWLLALSSPGIFAQDRASTAAELDAVRERIQELEQAVEAARHESATLEKKLREIESDIRASSAKLEKLRSDIQAQNERLESLKARRREYESRLGDAREALARQMRAAYKTGRRDYLKLLLNQQDPALMGRILSYYDYYNRARTEQIRAVSQELEQLAALARTVAQERAALSDLEQTEQARLAELKGLKKARNKVIAHLNAEIRDKSQRLTTLRDDQERLESLLEDLRRQERAPSKSQLPDFGDLRGKLDWPISGRLLNSFGSSRRGGALTWQGVRLAAEGGEKVRAVSAGQVIFADWFRTLGLLIIIEHGDGYMSLYGHNQELLKSQGAWVEDGEIIAHAGESGGQDRPALYFEIRHDGKPVDPTLWCRR